MPIHINDGLTSKPVAMMVPRITGLILIRMVMAWIGIKAVD